MTNKNELLSDLLDDRCSSEDLDSLLSDSDTLDQWYRYNTVSTLLKNEYSEQASSSFCKAISEKIAEEPAIIAAPIRNNTTLDNKSKIHEAKIFNLRGFTGGFAIAASVAMATFFSVQTMQPSALIDSSNQQAMEQSNSGKNSHSHTVTEDTQQVSISNVDILEQAELEVYNGLFLQEARRSNSGNFAPVSSEYVKTIRFSADQWQQILQKAVKKQADKDALGKDTSNKDTSNNDVLKLDATEGADTNNEQ